MGVRLDKDDINAVANSRFYRRVGARYLLGLAAVVVAITLLKNWWFGMPFPVAYGLYGISGLVFFMLYSRNQGKKRAELWKEIKQKGVETPEE